MLNVELAIVEAIIEGTPAVRLVQDLHSVAIGGVGRVEDVQAACAAFVGHGDVRRLRRELQRIVAQEQEAASAEAALALQMEEARAASRQQAEDDERKRKKALRREELDTRSAVRMSRELQEQEDFNVALNLGRQGPWFAEGTKRSTCGLPGCVAPPVREHHGFCSLSHREKASDRGLLAPPSD